jgi:MoaA/NifB/PqqE/SkfB family radical SAM enzyme
MPERMSFLPERYLLSLEELDRLFSAFVMLGVRKIRLTGGEPLVRRDLMVLTLPNKSHAMVAMASLNLREAAEQTGATPETVVTNDVAVAFAAIQVELTSLLGRIGEVRANEGLREDNPEKVDHLCEEAAAGTKSANAVIDKTETPIPTPPSAGVGETPRKRSWWRRFVR